MRICLVSLSDIPDDLPSLSFGESENKRLAAIRNPHRRKESLCALLALRELLGNPLPRIQRDPNGKPFFADSSLPPFSLCHGGEWAAAMLGDEASGAVGIDLEVIRPYPYAHRIAKRFFSSREYAEFLEADGSEQSFFHLWTQKEALSKLHGNGILSEEQAVADFCASYRLSLPNKTLMLSVCSEHCGKALSWQSPSECFTQIQIEEIFKK